MQESGLAINDIVRLEVADLVYPGRGLARLDGRVVFVPGALPDEAVSARITRLKKNYAEAELLQVESPSPDRIAPACPRAGECPGCSYQHLDYGAEIRIKNSQFRDLLKKLGKITEPPLGDPVPSPEPLGYRNRITLHAGPEASPAPLGYYGFDNRSVIDIPACPLAREGINRLLAGLREEQEFRAGLQPGESLLLRWTKTDGAICRRGKHRGEDTLLTETTRLGEVRVPLGSFFQVNVPVADRLLEDLAGVVSRLHPAAAIDLYCGCGIFALAAGKAGVPNVLGIDRDPKAVEAARENGRRHDLPGLQFETLSAPDGLRFGLGPLPPEETLLILDPPRTGLGKEVINLISRSGPASLVYISCGPDTLARDARLLTEAGYRMEQTGIYDMFPRTPHFESLTVFRRRAG